MRDWGNGLLSNLHKSRAVDLATNPATWIALLLAALATALAMREYGFEPPPFALQLADRRRWPVPWRDRVSTRTHSPWGRSYVLSARRWRFPRRPDQTAVARSEAHVDVAPEAVTTWDVVDVADWVPLFGSPDADRPAP
jgi:hypothetical protein